MDKDYEELKRQAKYRWEFFRRGESTQKILTFAEVARYLPRLIEAGFGLCPIEVVYDGKKKDLVCEWLSYYEGDYFQKTDELRKKLSKIKIHISLDGVDQKDKTITIKIHLDRKKQDIMKGVEYLLNTLKKEAKYFGKDFKRPKPHLDKYEKYLKVYDLRKEGKSWRQIACEVFPGDKSWDKGMRKVRYYYEQAKKMINGGWRLI